MKTKVMLRSINSVSGTLGVGLKLDTMNAALGGVICDQLIKLEHNNQIINTFKYQENGIIVNVAAKSLANAVTVLFNIPIKDINIGQITKALIIKAGLTNNADKRTDPVEYEYKKRYTVILDYTNIETSYDQEVLDMADKLGVTIITDSVIYSLNKKYNEYITKINNKILQLCPNIVSDISLKILPQYIFLKKNPILIGVKITMGEIKVGTLIKTDDINLGKIIGIQKNNKAVDKANKGDEVCIKIECDNKSIEYGKDFDYTHVLSNYIPHDEKMIADRYPDVFV
jgi:translation initiation factor 5B